MTALTVFGIIVLFFVFLLSLKATLTVAYSDEVALSVKVLFLKIKILPKKEKKLKVRSMSAKKAQKIREKAAKKEAKKAAQAKEKKAKKAQHKFEKKNQPKKTLSEILESIDLIRHLVATVIQTFFGHLRIKIARLKIKVATEDAAHTAIAYGAITQSVNLLFPLLEQVKNFDLPQAKEIDIQADFLSEKIEADIELSFSLRVWHLFDVAFKALTTFLKHKFSKAS